MSSFVTEYLPVVVVALPLNITARRSFFRVGCFWDTVSPLEVFSAGLWMLNHCVVVFSFASGVRFFCVTADWHFFLLQLFLSDVGYLFVL